MSTPGHVALVLHAHLPYVRHPEHPRSIEERWFFEALWESYLPLLGVLDRLAAEGVRAPLTLSVSPPLAAMLRDPMLCQRFEAHLGRVEALAGRAARVLEQGPLTEALGFYRRRIEATWAAWEGCGRDLLGALRRHAQAGHLALWTTAATHAFLPGLLPTPASIRAQIRLGRAGFGALVHGDAQVASPGFWLPECGWHPRLDAVLAEAGVGCTIVDAHALEMGTPRPAQGGYAPVLTRGGVACFGRDPVATREVWSRAEGYPGHPVYREFHRDVGFDLEEAVLGEELGPDGVRLMSGLKLHRITGPVMEKAPYDPDVAAVQARAHAETFVARRREHLARLPRGTVPPVVVAAYDAELFGHWWLEGPDFLEHALRGLAGHAGRAGEGAGEGEGTLVTPGDYLERHGAAGMAEPLASSWGEGGFGAVWIGPRTARLWRHVHHAERPVRVALVRARELGHEQGRALDQAIRELLLLQASDWAFMIDRDEAASYAELRVRAHAGRARQMAEIAGREACTPEDAARVAAACRQTPFLVELSSDVLREALA
ncbi:glycoside hydrolase family 57 protein [Chondromyces apiculatus]|uniref:glycoside hydrolase family 57 protein n=1 Tax=Chondromyces apiculatus TaxID=51 RepID=UPI0005C68053|nr:1,4-alpha-glucan branching protein domain-containing protein [Chondromyces apiculatus]